MIEQILSYVITAVGLAGFWLAGKKVWWCWWVNVANQILWTAFAVWTGYYAFLIGTAFYFFVFTKNGIQWTRERYRIKPQSENLLPYVTFDINTKQFDREATKTRGGVRDLQERLRGHHSGS